MTARRSATENDIPLYLIPHVIARQINKQGKEVWRISVKRTQSHYYNISVRTKSIPRELRIQNHRIPLSEDNQLNPDDDLMRTRDFGGDPE
jgi:hypothetical protein